MSFSLLRTTPERFSSVASNPVAATASVAFKPTQQSFALFNYTPVGITSTSMLMTDDIPTGVNFDVAEVQKVLDPWNHYLPVMLMSVHNSKNKIVSSAISISFTATVPGFPMVNASVTLPSGKKKSTFKRRASRSRFVFKNAWKVVVDDKSVFERKHSTDDFREIRVCMSVRATPSNTVLTHKKMTFSLKFATSHDPCCVPVLLAMSSEEFDAYMTNKTTLLCRRVRVYSAAMLLLGSLSVESDASNDPPLLSDDSDLPFKRRRLFL